jgi:hypothetical protein
MGFVHDRTDAGLAIGVMQFLDDLMRGLWRKAARDAKWRHVLVVESVDQDGTVHAIEAWPGGARRSLYRVDDPGIMWSSGRGGLFALTGGQRGQVVEWCVAHLKAGYSWADYALKALTDAPIPVPFVEKALERRVTKSGHFMCSWFAAASRAAVGVEWPQPVWDLDPDDLAALAETAPVAA